MTQMLGFGISVACKLNIYTHIEIDMPIRLAMMWMKFDYYILRTEFYEISILNMYFEVYFGYNFKASITFLNTFGNSNNLNNKIFNNQICNKWILLQSTPKNKYSK